MTVLFRPAAAADVEVAFSWYENQRVGLGDDFLEEIHATLGRVQENPNQFPIPHRQTRRALLHRFPYGLFYLVHDKDIIVLACMHASRAPRRWRDRR